MRSLLLLLVLVGAPGAAAQGRFLDPGQSALGVTGGLEMPSERSAVGLCAQVGRFGLATEVLDAPPPPGVVCLESIGGGPCPRTERRPSGALVASWVLEEQGERQPLRIEATAEVGLDRYEAVREEARDGFTRGRGALGLAFSHRADVHRPLLLVPSISLRHELAETFRGMENRWWVGGGLGWGVTLGATALGWFEVRSEVDFRQGGARTVLGGGLARTF